MSQATQRRVVLVARPQGALTPETFRVEQGPVPVRAAGQVLLRTVFLSIDPYMRGRLIEGPSYGRDTVAPGDVMLGETVSRVEASDDPALPAGTLVLANGGWQEYSLAEPSALSKIDASFVRPSYALGVLGMTGFTAYIGLFDIAEPRAGETVVVGAATGAVGSVVGQLAKLRGARTVGVAGGEAKCEYAVSALGYDVCLDHRAPELARRLRAACPSGIDVYFENVGGKLLGAALPLMNQGGRVPLCGFISRYERGADYANPGPDRTELLWAGILFRRLRVQGFLAYDHAARRGEFLTYMKPLVRDGRVKAREDIVAGLENAPAALSGLFSGQNFGKALVQVAEL